MVFTSLDDMARRIDDPALDVTPEDFLVLQNAGPCSPSGMPEAGYLPIPQKLARAGVKDMVRISDARMSGTAYGTVVLHVAPDAASGGPLGARAERRPHPPERQGAAARSSGAGGRAGAPSAAADAEARARLSATLPRRTCCRPTRAAISIFCAPARAGEARQTRGRRISTCVPAPGALVNATVPPCCSTTWRTVGSPRPVPKLLVL